MGNDTALAFLSDQDRPVYDFFKQLFAQVTNPPIDSDPRGSRHVARVRDRPGTQPARDHGGTSAGECSLPHPILSNREFAALGKSSAGDAGLLLPHSRRHLATRRGRRRPWQRARPALFGRLSRPSTRRCILVALSDRAAGPETGVPTHPCLPGGGRAPSPAQDDQAHPGRPGARNRRGTGGPSPLPAGGLRRRTRSTPTSTFEALWQARRQGLPAARGERRRGGPSTAYRKGVSEGNPQGDVQDGHLHAAELQGRADLRGRRPVERGIWWIAASPARTASRIEGAGLTRGDRWPRTLCAATPGASLPVTTTGSADLPRSGGDYHWRAGGERHMWNPRMISRLQHAARTNSSEDLPSSSPGWPTRTRPGRARNSRPAPVPHRHRRPCPSTQVEPASEIVKRFCHRRHELRLDLGRESRDPGGRHEPHRRQEQHRRGRRGPGTLHTRRRTATADARRSSRSPRDASA